MSNIFKSFNAELQSKILNEYLPEYHHGKMSLRQLSEELKMSVIDVIDLIQEFD